MSTMPVVLVTGGYDHKIRYWDATSGSCTRSITFTDSQINCLAISPDKNLLAAGGNPLIQIYDINSSEERPVLTYDSHTNNVTNVGFQKDIRWLYSCSEDGSIRIWDLRTNQYSRKYECNSSVNSVVLNADNSELISGDSNGYVKVWDLLADKCREEIIPVPDIPVRSISMASDDSMLSVGTHKGRLFVYSPYSPTKSLELVKEFQAHDEYLLKCLISPDVNTIATTSADKLIKLWNTRTWEVEKTLVKHQKWVWDCVFSADSLYLLSASSDQSAKLWDLRNGDVIRNYSGHNLAVTCVALNDTTMQ
eukprot:gene12793-17151_t